MSSSERLQGRNPVIEALQRQVRRVRVVRIDRNAKPDARVRQLIELAQSRRVPVEYVDRRELDRLSGGDVHNGVVAEADPLPRHSMSSLLAELEARREDPFVLLADELHYEHNLGAMLRSGLGAGLHGMVVPTRRSATLSPVVSRVSMGGVEGVPLVHEGISSALAQLRRAGVPIVGADMDGRPYWEQRLTGSVALVLGGESKGLSPTLRRRCDAIVSVPLANGLQSLNVSVTAAVLMFERVRQQAAERAAAQATEAAET